MAGVMKAFQYERAKARSPVMSRGLVTFIGGSELLGGLGLLLPALTHILPWLTPLAAVGLAVIMLLATLFHIRRGEGGLSSPLSCCWPSARLWLMVALS